MTMQDRRSPLLRPTEQANTESEAIWLLMMFHKVVGETRRLIAPREVDDFVAQAAADGAEVEFGEAVGAAAATGPFGLALVGAGLTIFAIWKA